MVDDLEDLLPLVLKCVTTQVFPKRVNDHRTQVKDQQTATDPEKWLFGQLVIDLIGLYRLIKEKAAEKYNKKRTQQRSITIDRFSEALKKKYVGQPEENNANHKEHDHLPELFVLEMEVKNKRVEDELKNEEHVVHPQLKGGILVGRQRPYHRHNFNTNGDKQEGQEIADQFVPLSQEEKNRGEKSDELKNERNRKKQHILGQFGILVPPFR